MHPSLPWSTLPLLRRCGLLVATLVGLLASFACDSGSSAPGTRPTDPTAASLAVTVADVDGRLLAGVAVAVGSGPAAATTDAAGRALVGATSPGEVVVHLSKPGFANQHKVLSLPAGARTASLSAVMIPRAAPLVLPDAALGGTVIGEDGATVALPAGALVLPSGAAASGPVEVTMTPVDVRTDLAAFPGLFEGRDGAGARTPIVTYGTVEFEFRQGGAELQLAAGATAGVELPLYPVRHENGSAIVAGDVIPLWSLDEATALWQQEGDGTVVAAAESPTGLALRGTVAHFSWWNADRARSLGTGDPFNATLVCELDASQGQPVRPLPPGSFATVTITVGDPTAPRAVVTTIVGPQGRSGLLPSGVPLLFFAEANIVEANGSSFVARGTLTAILPEGGQGVIAIRLDTPDLPTPFIVSPQNPVATNSSQPLYVEVYLDGSNRVPDEVQLLVDGRLLQSFPPQFFYRFFWDTAPEAEGTHVLSAVVLLDGNTRVSAPVTVVVDRTPPDVSSVDPAPGTKVLSQDTLTVTFTEPVTPFPFALPDLVTMSLLPPSGPLQSVPADVQLDPSGTVLQASSQRTFSAGTLGLGWAGLRDAAGNALTGIVAATWPLDQVQPIGPAFEHQDDGVGIPLVTDASGTPFVLHERANGDLTVSRFDGFGWVQVGDAVRLGPVPTTSERSHGLAIDASGGLWAAVSRGAPGGGLEVALRTFDGAGWVDAGAPLSGTSGNNYVALAIDAQQRPVVAVNRDSRVEVLRFQNGALTALAPPFVASNTLVFSLDLALQADTDPVVVWQEGFFGSNTVRIVAREFSNGTFQPLGGDIATGAFSISDPAIAVVGSRIVVAFALSTIHVREWDGTNWVDFPMPEPISFPSNFRRPGLTMDGASPVVAWGEAANKVFVRRLSGATWEAIVDAGVSGSFVPHPLLSPSAGAVRLTKQGGGVGHAVDMVLQ